MLNTQRVELLCLGDELLLGIRDNTHLTWLGQQLQLHGLILRHCEEIPDDGDEIAAQFLASWERSDILITTGGLGPTADDRTRETIAQVLGVKLVKSERVEQAIRERFARMGRTPTANNLKQTYLLEGAEELVNDNGTAPGQWFERDGKILIMLPGPTSELHPMFASIVLPRLQERGLIEEGDAYLQLRTCGVGESKLETILTPVFERFPGRLQVAYCAHDGMVDLRLSRVGHSLSEEELKTIAEECRGILGEDFVCYGDCCIGCHVYHRLRALNKTLAVAESCTGGALASAFTDIAGASKVFIGGLVCYSNDAKVQLLDVPEDLIVQHGAVSEECAAAMATNAAEKFGSDYALSITGFAGPCGGTQENPVGTVFIGLSAPAGVWVHRVVYPGDRLKIKARAVNTALDWMRRKLSKYEVFDTLESLSC